MNKNNSVIFAEHVGNRIKFYRRIKHMSLEQLAVRIHKSKSTLSKYENGQIAIDVNSLFDIANALGVDISQFVDYNILSSPVNTSPYANPFGGKANVYIYYYDGRTNRIVKTLLVFKHNQVNNNSIPCHCYMDAPSFEEYNNCKYFYTGVMTYFDLVSYVTLSNLSNPMEQIGLCMLNPFHHNRDTWGFMFGISYNPITPFALKFLLSTSQIPDSALTKEELTLTKNELKMIKNLNMMLLNTQAP